MLQEVEVYNYENKEMSYAIGLNLKEGQHSLSFNVLCPCGIILLCQFFYEC